MKEYTVIVNTHDGAHFDTTVVDNLLWAARELAAGRELSVEGANYLCDAQDWLNAQKGAA